MKIEFFYKCKDGRVIGRETECKDNLEDKIKYIKTYAHKLENDESYGESVLELED